MPSPKRATHRSQLRLCFSSPLLNYFIKCLYFLVIYFCMLVYACTPHGSVLFFWPLFRTTASTYNLFRIFMLIFNFTWCLNHDKLSNIQRIRIQEAWKKWTKKRDGELHSALSVPRRIARRASVARFDRWLRLRISYSLWLCEVQVVRSLGCAHARISLKSFLAARSHRSTHTLRPRSLLYENRSNIRH